MVMMSTEFQTLLLVLATAMAAHETAAFSSITSTNGGSNKRCRRSHQVPHAAAAEGAATATDEEQKDRPLLRQFGRGMNERVINSKGGFNRFGLTDDHYTSAETIPCLDMQSCSGAVGNSSSRKEIRKAYSESGSSNHPLDSEGGGIHGRSSGSGCSIIRLRGKDAVSVRGLVDFADDFFDGVDDDDCNEDIKGVGFVRIANNVHAGFDNDVNDQGKMQVLYTKLIPQIDEESIMLPMEVGDLVGKQSLSHAHTGMNTLFDIGSQITSAVLGLTSSSTDKLLDDGTAARSGDNLISADNVSNSYQRLIRYLKPQDATASENDTAFWPHVDSTFLTLIPMPELPGLEVWCPSKSNASHLDLDKRGEWVRPIIPFEDDESISGNNDDEDNCAYVVVLSGEFLQLLSDGQVPTCIHRVIPPRPASLTPAALTKYKPRVSAPLFVRPRRRGEAILDVASDLNNLIGGESEPTMAMYDPLYFEEGLMEECDEMHIWDYMDAMSPKN